MFENDIFEKWLDQKSKELITKIGSEEALKTEMIELRKDMDKRFDKTHNILMWGFGLMFSLFAGLYIPMLVNFLRK
ncbi:MAG: hypothetical protein GY830_02175 [Bacteroidetes bacterium]|nr:hypothetical protein [Bacteroidota bacterium]